MLDLFNTVGLDAALRDIASLGAALPDLIPPDAVWLDSAVLASGTAMLDITVIDIAFVDASIFSHDFPNTEEGCATQPRLLVGAEEGRTNQLLSFAEIEEVCARTQFEIVMLDITLPDTALFNLNILCIGCPNTEVVCVRPPRFLVGAGAVEVSTSRLCSLTEVWESRAQPSKSNLKVEGVRAEQS
jgi:hypothetical protein